MQIIVQVFNDELVATKFNRMGMSAAAAQPILSDVADVLMDIIRKNFESQGRRGGGSWKALTPEWVRWKYHHGYSTAIGTLTGDLEESLTMRGHPDQILAISNESVTVGSSLSYAAKFNRTRKIGKTTDRDRKNIRDMIQRELINVWRMTRV